MIARRWCSRWNRLGLTFPFIYASIKWCSFTIWTVSYHSQKKTISFLILCFCMHFFFSFFFFVECDDEHPCQGLGEHAHFKNFGIAFLTLFRVATGDNWNGIMKVRANYNLHCNSCEITLNWNYSKIGNI